MYQRILPSAGPDFTTPHLTLSKSAYKNSRHAIKNAGNHHRFPAFKSWLFFQKFLVDSSFTLRHLKRSHSLVKRPTHRFHEIFNRGWSALGLPFRREPDCRPHRSLRCHPWHAVRGQSWFSRPSFRTFFVSFCHSHVRMTLKNNILDAIRYFCDCLLRENDASLS